MSTGIEYIVRSEPASISGMRVHHGTKISFGRVVPKESALHAVKFGGLWVKQGGRMVRFDDSEAFMYGTRGQRGFDWFADTFKYGISSSFNGAEYSMSMQTIKDGHIGFTPMRDLFRCNAGPYVILTDVCDGILDTCDFVKLFDSMRASMFRTGAYEVDYIDGGVVRQASGQFAVIALKEDMVQPNTLGGNSTVSISIARDRSSSIGLYFAAHYIHGQ